MVAETQNIIVQGASRGIGLAAVAQLLASRTSNCVFATSRKPHESEPLARLAKDNPGRLFVGPMDITSEDSVETAFSWVGQHVAEVHGVYNFAGLLHGETVFPERRLEQVSGDSISKYFSVNATGPLLVAKYALPYISHGERVVFASLSARIGSIEDNRRGGWYGYRASKAAQNMFTKTLSIELARRAPKVICIALHPGTVDSQLSKPFQRSVPPGGLFTVERAAQQLLSIIDSVTAEETGHFFAWDRTKIPW